MHPLPLVTSSSNPLVKQARALRQRKARAEAGQFLVEGLHHVGAALDSQWEVDALLYAPDLLTSEFGRSLIERAARLPFKLQPVSAQIMESLAEKDHPTGLLAIVRQRTFSLEALHGLTRLVALVSPQDPGNVGTILRTMDAVGADGLLLLEGGVDLYHPSVVRASMGALFWQPVVQASFAHFAVWARRENYQLIGTSARGEVDHRLFAPQPPWVLMLGNEQKGLSHEQSAACDVTVSLPMRGRVSSLNLSVAAGVLLYALCAA